MRDIADILQTPSGRQLIGGLTDQPADHKTSINEAAMVTRCRQPSGALWASAAGRNVADGSDSAVAYSPGVVERERRRGHDAPWNGTRSDVALHHELTHAMHIVNGTFAMGQVDAGDGVGIDAGVPRGEHQAVGLGAYADAAVSENRYRAERAAIAAGTMGAVPASGTFPGDAGMPRRDSYCLPPLPVRAVR
jgi:hypothetical protein